MNAPATSADSAGRRRTRSTIAPQIRPSPSSRRSRPTSGTRSRSTLSPSFESKAGRTVREPSTATATTRIVAMPSEANVPSPVRNMPAIATITVSPEMSTERPDVAAAASSAACRAAPGCALLALALEVEHRVVDADRKADQQHHRVGLRRERQQVARQRDQPERREHGGQREQQRNARGHQCPECEHEDDERDRERESAGLAQIVAVGGLDRLDRARVPELADEEAGVSALRIVDALSGPARPCRPPWSCRRGSRTPRAPNARPARCGRRSQKRAASGRCGRPAPSKRARRRPRLRLGRRDRSCAANDSG